MKAIPIMLGALLGLTGLTTTQAQDKDALQRFAGANAWLNSQPLGPAELRAGFILVSLSVIASEATCPP
jgi:hypothetical protein